MGTPFFHEFKKQASFFIKEKIKTARLALTDVTPAELLTEEATKDNPWAPDTRTMGLISRAAFEVDDYWRIVEILHKRLSRFDKKNWRGSYNALILLEHLLTHGPESVAEEFQSDEKVIREMGSFQYIDEKGFNWGFAVRKKSERILKLLEKGPYLKEERTRARKLTCGIKGFGSFCERNSTIKGNLKETSFRSYGRSKSQYTNHPNEKDDFSDSKDRDAIEKGTEKMKKIENLTCVNNSQQIIEKKTESTKKILEEEFLEWKGDEETELVLGDPRVQKKGDYHLVEEEHPFNDDDRLATASLLSPMQVQ